MRWSKTSFLEQGADELLAPQREPGELRPEVLAFARLMEAKLRQHDDRPGWKDASIEWLFHLMLDEVEEMRSCLRPGGRQPPSPEAVDIANFAMMIADVEGALDSVSRPPQPEPGEERMDDFRIKRLEDALRPFADLSENKRYLEVALTEDDFHRAHDVLYAEPDPPADLPAPQEPGEREVEKSREQEKLRLQNLAQEVISHHKSLKHSEDDEDPAEVHLGYAVLTLLQCPGPQTYERRCGWCGVYWLEGVDQDEACADSVDLYPGGPLGPHQFEFLPVPIPFQPEPGEREARERDTTFALWAYRDVLKDVLVAFDPDESGESIPLADMHPSQESVILRLRAILSGGNEE